MLADYTAIPTLAVADIAKARSFYEGVLGLFPDSEVAEGLAYSTGSGRFLVYPSSFAGTNKATYMSFQVPAEAFDAEISALREEGVEFLTFDLPSGSWDDGVASFEGYGKSAWFEDPDGNILNIEHMS